MYKIFLLIFLLLMTQNCSAENAGFDAAIQSAKIIGEQKKNEAFNQFKQFDPHSVFNKYSDHPKESHYYGGVQQADTSQMTDDALRQQTSGTGKVIDQSIRQHPKFIIGQNDQDIQHAKLLQTQADNIVHGVINQYIDCQPKQTCTLQYQKKSCLEAPQTIFQSCKKKLTIKIITHEKIIHYPLVAHLSARHHDYAAIAFNVTSGSVYSYGPREARFGLDGRLPKDLNCQQLESKVVAATGGARIDYIYFPTCNNDFTLNFRMIGGHQLNLQLDVMNKIETTEVQDVWIDDCSGLKNDTSCQVQTKQCEIPHSTKMIEGVPVTRDCWQENFNYICRLGGGTGNCGDLRKTGCEQVDSVCQKYSNNQCILYQQSYLCQTQSCSQTNDVICSNGKDYCLDGSCTDHQYQKNTDFGKSVSALSAADASGKALDQSSLTIFSGHSIECSEKPVGYSNCCTEDGWGQDIGLDHCPEVAKELHVKREKHLAIKVGRYCSGPDPFPCIEHSQTFCVFDSQLAKIMQEQGRAGQLHLGFGRAQSPDCRGITPEQLQQIDLNHINFQEYINGLNSQIKQPDLKKIQELMAEHIARDQNARHINDEF